MNRCDQELISHGHKHLPLSVFRGLFAQLHVDFVPEVGDAPSLADDLLGGLHLGQTALTVTHVDLDQ